MSQASKDNKIAYILGNYPGKIETFVLNEMKELGRMGFNIYVCPIHHVPMNDKSKAEWGLNAIYAEPFNLPWIILAHLSFMLFKPMLYLKCLLKHRSYGGKRVFLKSVYFAWVIQKLGIKHIHAHFGWTATDSARVIKRLTPVPYSFTAHQSDIHRKVERLEEKLKEARFVITCTRGNKEFISNKYGKEIGEKTHAVYHGVDLDLFSPKIIDADKELDIISVGNLFRVKGFCYLIEACWILSKKGILNSCIVVGEGEERHNLQEMIDGYDLKGKVKILKKVPQYELAKLYAKARVFVLPITVINGAPHGIPNVIAEAMAMGLPVVSSNVPNISELIEHDKDGILVREKDPEAIAEAIEKLLLDKKVREDLGKNARTKIEDKFNTKEHIHKIATLFLNN